MKRNALQTGLYCLLTIFTLLVLYAAYAAGITEGGYYVFAVVFFFLSCVLSPALHEAGHVVCGKLCGMRFVSVSVPLLTIYKTDGKLYCKWNTTRASETAGACRMYPEKAEKAERKFFFFAAGGVLFNVVHLIVGLIFCLFFDNGILWLTLGMTLPYCAYLLILNLLPSSSGEGNFDGAIIWGLLKREPSALVEAKLFVAQGYILLGKTPGLVPRELFFDLPQLPEDDPNFTAVQLWRYAYFLDRWQKENAANCVTRLESCLEYIPESQLLPVYCELTYAYSFLIPDKAAAQKYYDELKKGKIPGEYAADACRAEAAYALLYENEALADQALRDAKALIEREEEGGMKKFRTRLAAKLEDALRESDPLCENGAEEFFELS